MPPDITAAKVLSPEGYCVTVDIDAGGPDWLEFQLMPDTISENKTANYDPIAIIGRSLPILGYANSSSRSINLELEFAALNRSGKYSPTWVKDQVRWLESKVYPEYESGWVYPPHRMQLIVGQALGMLCVMTSCTTTWSKPWTTSIVEPFAYRASVACSFQECGQNNDSFGHPHGWADAKSGMNQALGGSGYIFSTTYYEIPTNVG
jgi:hypothetical protein